MRSLAARRGARACRGGSTGRRFAAAASRPRTTLESNEQQCHGNTSAQRRKQTSGSIGESAVRMGGEKRERDREGGTSCCKRRAVCWHLAVVRVNRSVRGCVVRTVAGSDCVPARSVLVSCCAPFFASASATWLEPAGVQRRERSDRPLLLLESRPLCEVRVDTWSRPAPSSSAPLTCACACESQCTGMVSGCSCESGKAQVYRRAHRMHAVDRRTEPA